MPPYSVGMLRLLNPASRALSRSVCSFSSSISPRSAISASNGWSSSLTNRGDAGLQLPYLFGDLGPSPVRRRRHSSISSSTSWGREGRSCPPPCPGPSPARTAPSSMSSFGRSSTAPSEIKRGHLLPERRPPHHPVPPRGQDVETLHRLVDDREVVRRVVYGCRPRPRYRQAPRAPDGPTPSRDASSRSSPSRSRSGSAPMCPPHRRGCSCRARAPCSSGRQ